MGSALESRIGLTRNFPYCQVLHVVHKQDWNGKEGALFLVSGS
jgi:hypothetical protein